MLLRGQHYRTGQRLDVRVAAGRIVQVTPASIEPADLEGTYLAPALVDVQINGGHGVNFTTDALTVVVVVSVVRHCHARGIGHFCPTVITAPFETMRHALTTLAQACDRHADVAATLPGFHLEGPYISAEDGPRGAHPRQHVRPADLNEFQRLQDAADGRIRLVTLAPEIPGALALIEALTKLNIRVAIGHTAATPTQIRDAVRAGATLSTHLGNGCPLQLPRHDNLLWEQLACDTLTASIIPDGHHLPWPLVQCILRCKGPSRLIIISDASPLAGLAPGCYHPWGDEVEVLHEGKIVVPGQGVLAGSWDFTNRCVEKLLEHADGWPLAEVHDLASVRPAAVLGFNVGIEVGMPARVVLYRKNSNGQLLITHAVIGDQVFDVAFQSLTSRL